MLCHVHALLRRDFLTIFMGLEMSRINSSPARAAGEVYWYSGEDLIRLNCSEFKNLTSRSWQQMVMTRPLYTVYLYLPRRFFSLADRWCNLVGLVYTPYPAPPKVTIFAVRQNIKIWILFLLL